ncbi:MAG TPA: tRNA 2-thiouridine(34) synthase MnmA [Nitrospiria bacterium]|nr:tRNA 2-thiouridine(34) synthase MnmA [Nitrospiria bacterium]
MKIAVGMSGGVDSAVTAALLKKAGHEVIGLYLRLYKDDENDEARWLDKSCCKIGLARHVTRQLGIELRIVDAQELFRENVINYFKEEYLQGKTPNPCVRCNEKIKFGVLVEEARKIGAEKLATGHYAKTSMDPVTGRWKLTRPADRTKDQTYFLYRMTQNQLAFVEFPLSGFIKSDIYKLAEGLDFPYEDVLESQEVCFVNQGDYRDFLKGEDGNRIFPGDFISSEGKRLGDHQGFPNYTVGQRKGLGIALGKRQFVLEIRPESNEVVIGEESKLYKTDFQTGNLNWISFPRLEKEIPATVKFRYKTPEVRGILAPVGSDQARFTFFNPQKGIAPGQSAVFYNDKDEVLGGGTIL